MDEADLGRRVADDDHRRPRNGVAGQPRHHAGDGIVVDDVAADLEVAVVLEHVADAGLTRNDMDRRRALRGRRPEVEEAVEVAANHCVVAGGSGDREAAVDVAGPAVDGREAGLPEGDVHARNRPNAGERAARRGHRAPLIADQAGDGGEAGVDERRRGDVGGRTGRHRHVQDRLRR